MKLEKRNNYKIHGTERIFFISMFIVFLLNILFFIFLIFKLEPNLILNDNIELIKGLARLFLTIVVTLQTAVLIAIAKLLSSRV